MGVQPRAGVTPPTRTTMARTRRRCPRGSRLREGLAGTRCPGSENRARTVAPRGRLPADASCLPGSSERFRCVRFPAFGQHIEGEAFGRLLMPGLQAAVDLDQRLGLGALPQGHGSGRGPADVRGVSLETPVDVAPVEHCVTDLVGGAGTPFRYGMAASGGTAGGDGEFARGVGGRDEVLVPRASPSAGVQRCRTPGPERRWRCVASPPAPCRRGRLARTAAGCGVSPAPPLPGPGAGAQPAGRDGPGVAGAGRVRCRVVRTAALPVSTIRPLLGPLPAARGPCRSSSPAVRRIRGRLRSGLRPPGAPHA